MIRAPKRSFSVFFNRAMAPVSFSPKLFLLDVLAEITICTLLLLLAGKFGWLDLTAREFSWKNWSSGSFVMFYVGVFAEPTVHFMFLHNCAIPIRHLQLWRIDWTHRRHHTVVNKKHRHIERAEDTESATFSIGSLLILFLLFIPVELLFNRLFTRVPWVLVGFGAVIFHYVEYELIHVHNHAPKETQDRWEAIPLLGWHLRRLRIHHDNHHDTWNRCFGVTGILPDWICFKKRQDGLSMCGAPRWFFAPFYNLVEWIDDRFWKTIRAEMQRQDKARYSYLKPAVEA